MKARDQRTGKPIVAMLETYLATTRIDPDSFERHPADGTLQLEYSDAGAEIHYDTGEPAKNDDGQAIYQDCDGNEVPEDQIELY